MSDACIRSYNAQVTNAAGESVHAQVAPVVVGGKRLGFAAGKFQLSFPVTVESLALAVYGISLRDSDAINKWVTRWTPADVLGDTT